MTAIMVAAAATGITSMQSSAGAAAPAPIRINAGGGAMVDPAGLSWRADRAYVGGSAFTGQAAIVGTDKDPLYRSLRWGMSAYRIPVPGTGTYRLRMRMVEQTFNAPGRRVFSVRAEGAAYATGLDVFARVGKNRALLIDRQVTVTDGTLSLTFSARVDNAMVSAIEVVPVSVTVPPPAPAGPAVGSQFHCMWAGASGYSTTTFDATRATVLDRLKAGGVTDVRIDVGWDGLQPTNTAIDPANWYVKLLDGCVDGARARGMRVLLTLDRSPKWARPGAYAGTARVLPADPNAIRTVSAFLASRYAGRVAAIEVWNEPNLREFVQVVDPVKYVAVLGAAHSAIKAANPAMQVMFSGADRIAVSPGGSVVDDYYTLAYNAGAKGKFDILGVHAYQGPANAAPEAPDEGPWRISHMPHLVKLMAARGDGAKPIWVTEFGWSVHANAAGAAPWNLGVTEQQQADYTVRAYAMFAKWPQVKVAHVYNDRQKATGNVHQDGYGLLRRDLSPRPVLAALMARRR